MSSIPKQLLLQAVLILLNAFFAASEIAVISLSPTKLRRMAEEGNKSAPRLLKLVEEPAGFLSTIQIGITMAGYLGSAFAAENFSDYIVTWIYDGLGFHALAPAALNSLSIVIVTIILGYFTLVLGELLPKRIAMQKPMEVARITSVVVGILAVVVKPVIRLLSASTNGLLRLLGMKTEAEDETVSEDEIRMMVDLGEERGAIDTDEKEWIQNVFEFNDVSVCDAMTRAPDVEAISLEATKEEILALIRETGLSRFPVYDEDINDVVGILNARDFLLSLGEGKPCDVTSLMRKPYCVPESIRADQLFKDMQLNKVHIAVVIDEYGEMAGIITIEDLLEQIVGNIYDEFDPEEPEEIQQISENLWRVSGSTRVEDLAEALDMDIPEDEDYDTVGGMVFSCLHTIPQDGDTLEVEVKGLRIHVKRIEDRRVEEALVEKLPPDERETSEEED
ncbi:MAG: hemolysin family protein [Candidatus Pelethousia sp.]|nr:hemolysin family protein [Candidatus Pelethousia sp.]